MVFVLEDLSTSPPQSVRNAKIACKSGMPNVPGHIHNLGIHTEHPEVAPGRDELQLGLSRRQRASSGTR
ncbi:MAG: hypothetical protein Q8T11_00720 [Elusimicrobiota bacterium]|nr:hypothetical protein [Elusimicrobiota bacterium]